MVLGLVPDGDASTSVNFGLPAGLVVLEDFITEAEEQRLVDLVEWNDGNASANSVLKHRQVKHFGYQFRYDTNNVDAQQPLADAQIPTECDFLWSKAIASAAMPQLGNRPQQLTVNKYEPGQGKLVCGCQTDDKRCPLSHFYIRESHCRHTAACRHAQRFYRHNRVAVAS